MNKARSLKVSLGRQLGCFPTEVGAGLPGFSDPRSTSYRFETDLTRCGLFFHLEVSESLTKLQPLLFAANFRLS